MEAVCLRGRAWPCDGASSRSTTPSTLEHTIKEFLEPPNAPVSPSSIHCDNSIVYQLKAVLLSLARFTTFAHPVCRQLLKRSIEALRMAGNTQRLNLEGATGPFMIDSKP